MNGLTASPIQGNPTPSTDSYANFPRRKDVKRVYIESHGCQMNFSDSEIVISILQKEGFETTEHAAESDLILINTCAIREKAEQKVRNRLVHFEALKKKNKHLSIGILGCMAEHFKHKLLEDISTIDFVLGPDAYRDLPQLVQQAEAGERGINTFLSREETYADISPVRLNSNGVTAFISIMRGCDNMCSFCVVPFTRGRERSRSPHSIVNEAKNLYEKGFREVTLLGQNVDSYQWSSVENNKARLAKITSDQKVRFAHLLEQVAQINPKLRVRFSTSHPKDLTDEVLYTMQKYDNICKHIHLPAQSGSSRILELMNRTYNREWYLERIDSIRTILGNECSISSDIIAGFCSETASDHQDTLTLMDQVRYHFSYMFCYSERSGTLAAKKLKDDVNLTTKKARLKDIIEKQNQSSLQHNRTSIGKTFEVLVEGYSKRTKKQMQGRNTCNQVVVFDGTSAKGSYVYVEITDCTSATLLGKLV